MFDEALLAQLDRCDEVRREGRSAVLRRAAAEFLRHRQRAAIADQYRRAYAEVSELDGELVGWDEEGSWPAS